MSLETLVQRNDEQTWGILQHYAMKNLNNLVLLGKINGLTREKIAINKTLEYWISAQYHTALSEYKRLEYDIDPILLGIYENFHFMQDYDYWDFSGSDEDIQKLKLLSPQLKTENLLKKHNLQPNDSLESLAEKYHTHVERLLEHNPHIKITDELTSSTPFYMISIAENWPEERIFGNLPTLIREGDLNAISYFLKWIKTISKNSLEDFNYHITYCLKALGEVTPLWEYPHEEYNPIDSKEQRLLSLCLWQLQHIEGINQELLSYIDSSNETEISLSLEVLTVTADPIAKKPALKILREKESEYSDSELLYYLGSFDNVADSKFLKKILEERILRKEIQEYYKPTAHHKKSDSKMYHQKHMEGTIRNIDLSHILKQTLKELTQSAN